MIKGGIAGKLGNRYEAKWLVRSFLDVIANKAHWLKYEGVEAEYRGFEFAVSRGDIIEWHQTKMNSSKGNWTIDALAKEGVLKAFSNRLSTDGKAHCFFVSQDSAKDFRMFTEKAQITDSVEQFEQNLAKDQRKPFDQLKLEWSQPDEIVFDWLKRSHVMVFPERELDSAIESRGDLYFQKGGSVAFQNLRDILENNFNKTLTVELARDAIKIQGALKFKEWAFDPAIQQKLKVETDAYLQTYGSADAGGETIFRSQTTTLVTEILKPDGPELVLLTGVAGVGKSGVVRSAIKQIEKQRIPCLAFRVDQYLRCCTREELGKTLMGREESPVSTLKGTFPDTPAVLFIDQVDAISEVSGRDGQVKEVILRLIADAHNFGGIKIVLVCRTFDLDNDPRLRELKQKKQAIQIDVPLLDWKTEVEPLLIKKGVNVSSLKERERQWLCLPVNLAAYLSVDEPNVSFCSLSYFHEKLLKRKEREISGTRSLQWGLMEPLMKLCDWMSERQMLNAPALILDLYPSSVDILASEGLIVLSRGQVNFIHESFFDFIFARSFVNQKTTLIDLLKSTEQHLFRRTQVRQILEALRQNDLLRYHAELSSVLSSEDKDVRFHIKVAVCQWLNSIDTPDEQEYTIISRFDNPNEKFHQLFRSAVLSTHAWFDLLNEKGWLGEQLTAGNNERTERILWWLSNIAGERPVAIAGLLRAWWNGDQDRAEQLLNWFGFIRRSKPDKDLLRLCEDVINSHPRNLFQEKGRDRILMLLHTWGESSSEDCGRVLHSLFEAWFAINPGRNPFERDELKMFDIHSLGELARKSPQSFLQGTTDAIVRSIDMLIANGERNGGDVVNYRTFSGDRFGCDEFIEMYRSALKEVLKDDPQNGLGLTPPHF